MRLPDAALDRRDRDALSGALEPDVGTKFIFLRAENSSDPTIPIASIWHHHIEPSSCFLLSDRRRRCADRPAPFTRRNSATSCLGPATFIDPSLSRSPCRMSRSCGPRRHRRSPFDVVACLARVAVERFLVAISTGEALSLRTPERDESPGFARPFVVSRHVRVVGGNPYSRVRAKRWSSETVPNRGRSTTRKRGRPEGCAPPNRPDTQRPE